MADDYIEVPPDDGSPGAKKVQTHKNTIGANDVHAEAHVIVESDGSELAKAEDAVHASGDKGFVALGVRDDDATAKAADGDYTPFLTSDHGCLNIDPQHYKVLDDCDATAGWTALNTDTTGLTTDLDHVWKTKSLEFDKVDGAANTIFGAIQKTLTSFSLNKHIEEGGGFILFSINLSSLTDVAYAFIRLGTDNANYNEFRIADDDLTTGWNNVRMPLTRPDTAGATGDGWDTSAITYVCVGVAFDLQNNLLADIRVDSLMINSGMQVSADITAQVTSEVSSPNVIVRAWGAAVDTNQGNAGANTLRVAVADDDTNLAKITAATELIDDAVHAEDDAHTSTDKGIQILGVRNDTPTVLTSVDGDYSPIAVDDYGRPKVRTVHETTVYTSTDFDAAADGNLVAAGGGGVVTKIHYLRVQTHGSVTVNIEDGNGGASLWEFKGEDREGDESPFVPVPAQIIQSSANTALYVNLSAAVTVVINAVYTQA